MPAEPANEYALKHGGEGAVKAIQHGRDLTGLAAREEELVKREYAELGRAELVEEQAIRLHTASRLYWNAVQAAADAGDLDKLDAYVARFGWLASATLRAWAEVRREEASKPRALDYDELVKELKRNGRD